MNAHPPLYAIEPLVGKASGLRLPILLSTHQTSRSRFHQSTSAARSCPAPNVPPTRHPLSAPGPSALAQPEAVSSGRPRITFEQIRAREDANGDGRVTRQEFKGPPVLFDRLDRNHDGVLTKEDFDPVAPSPKGSSTNTPAKGTSDGGGPKPAK